MFNHSYQFPQNPMILPSNYFYWYNTPLVSHPGQLYSNIVLKSNRTIESQESSKNQIKPREIQVKADQLALEQKAIIVVKKKMILKGKQQIKKQRQDNFERKKQKKSRNLPSNILKGFFNFLYNHPNPTNLFYAKKIEIAGPLQQLIQNLKNYVAPNLCYIRPKLIKQLVLQDILPSEQKFLFRILLKKFLLFQLPIVVVMQRKLKKKQKLENIRMGKSLYLNLISK